MSYLDTALKYPYEYQLLFNIIEKKSLTPEKHCTHIVLVMSPESFELVFLGVYFIGMSQQ